MAVNVASCHAYNRPLVLREADRGRVVVDTPSPHVSAKR